MFLYSKIWEDIYIYLNNSIDDLNVNYNIDFFLSLIVGKLVKNIVYVYIVIIVIN